MSETVCDIDDLERVGFRVRGIGQILRAFAGADPAGTDRDDAYVILAEEAADYIRAHVTARAG